MDDASCMSCEMKWDREFMYMNLDKAFMMREYKEHRENVLVEREMGMLMETQAYVERDIRIDRLNKKIKKLNGEYEWKIKKIKNELNKLKNEWNIKLSEMSNELKREKETLIVDKSLVRKCSNGVCNGFLSRDLKCEICGCLACGECRESKGFTIEEIENHECDKDILESVKLLEKDSKECPKCSVLIYKIDGCDQMYCMKCHATFSWDTLIIQKKGVIHNPHYLEYQRQLNNGVLERNPLDIQCGRELDRNFIVRLMRKFEQKLPNGWSIERREIGHGINRRMRRVYIGGDGTETYSSPVSEDKIVKICRNVMSLNVSIREESRFNVETDENKVIDLRVDYMRNKIDKEKFKSILQKREKDNMKKVNIREVLLMYVSVMTDLFYRLNFDKKLKKEIIYEMNGLKEYTNNCLMKLSRVHVCKKYEINDNFELI
jgi:hypothetical protein